MKSGTVKIGLSIGIVAIVSSLIFIGTVYADICKGVEAYEKTISFSTQLAVIEAKLDGLICTSEEIKDKIDELDATKKDK